MVSPLADAAAGSPARIRARDLLNQRRQDHRLLGGYETIKPGDRSAELADVPAAAGKAQTGRLDNLTKRRQDHGAMEGVQVDTELSKSARNDRLGETQDAGRRKSAG